MVTDTVPSSGRGVRYGAFGRCGVTASTWIKIRMRNYRTFTFNSSEGSASSNPADIYSWHHGTL